MVLVSCGGFFSTVQWSGIGTERNGKGPVTVTAKTNGTVKGTDPYGTVDIWPIPFQYRNKGPVFERYCTAQAPVIVPVKYRSFR